MCPRAWSGPDLTDWQDDTPWKYGNTTNLAQVVSSNCVDWGTSNYWKIYMYHQYWENGVWYNFTPYPGTHPPRYQGCFDIARDND